MRGAVVGCGCLRIAGSGVLDGDLSHAVGCRTLHTSCPPFDPLPSIRKRYGLLVAAYPVGNLVGSFVMGYVSDRTGRKFVLMLGLFCGGGLYVWIALAKT